MIYDLNQTECLPDLSAFSTVPSLSNSFSNSKKMKIREVMVPSDHLTMVSMVMLTT